MLSAGNKRILEWKVNQPVCPTRNITSPKKLFVEITTRCNIECAMCVKQSVGCGISEGDMVLETFEALIPALKQIDTLILNGIGEPLLHPLLEDFVVIAGRHMPEGSRIGFQTNGQLLTDTRLFSLMEGGLNLISFSLDVADNEGFTQIREGAELSGIAESLEICRRARDAFGPDSLDVGIEAVLQLDTMERLPETLAWAAGRGADFALVSHLLSYDESTQGSAVFDRCTDGAIAHYREWRERAVEAGLDLEDYYRIRWKYIKSEKESALSDFVDRMVKAAYDDGIFFHLKNHLDRDEEKYSRLQSTLDDCRRIAGETGLRLELPESAPTLERRCDFIEEGGTFISWTGTVHPCYFLWHSYSCFVTDWRKYVTAKDFGRIPDRPVLEIWNSEDYRLFRETAAEYNYPFCTNCTLAPCDYIDSTTFEQDCYTNTIPCGDCQWCLGLFRCLQ